MTQLEQPKRSRSSLYGDTGVTAGWRERRARRAAAIAAYDPTAEPADIHPEPTVDVIPRVMREHAAQNLRAMFGDLDINELEDMP